MLTKLKPFIITLSSMLLLLSGCTTAPVNPPLKQVDTQQGYRPQNHINRPGSDNETLMILAFSGGGTRAAAFSYGVLKAMSQITVPGKEHLQGRSLVDEVDIITSVSGGSFTAAYFGLFGNRIFDDFEERFLKRDVQGELASSVLFNPYNWFRLASPFFGRSHLATELYDETIFDHSTFADLAKSNGPFIAINATEMSLGSRMQFEQNYFDVICSDITEMSVARAVTASSAVPLLFDPITLTNRGGSCGWQQPSWMSDVLKTRERTSRLYNVASNWQAYENSEERKYLHLLDGGLADNLGLRAMLDGILRFGSITKALTAMDIANTKRIIVVLVNAETALDVESSKHLYAPTLSAVLNAATSVPLQRYSFETVALLKRKLEQWEEESYRAACGADAPEKSDNNECHGVDISFIEVNFSEHPDPKERDYLKRLPTSFSLSDEEVDRLVNAGGLILRNNAAAKKVRKKREASLEKASSNGQQYDY